jgi:hypothetical protein
MARIISTTTEKKLTTAISVTIPISSCLCKHTNEHTQNTQAEVRSRQGDKDDNEKQLGRNQLFVRNNYNCNGFDLILDCLVHARGLHQMT